ncbi:NADH-ubiquinone oxidoreductase 75 kDa subunit, mitochondrial [Quillaja saponaria]|uniref:NADH-ubiquinone oxidoreductase 75 kDa subunit, mitochondrial n=1 Tax=Quillaja saponaria TaxID=32244 RepID=A0AAD7PGS2_QUISA|nr:NADH-ubiquinone oxidoreductase 75 kDa subunit, mitochondrial [Quillaja saponaria]
MLSTQSPPSMVPISMKEGSNYSHNASLRSTTNMKEPMSKNLTINLICSAVRRRVRYEDEDEDEDEEYGQNEEIGKLELYSESARGEALLVHAVVDEEEVEVLIFKGFSSCLNYKTSPDPTRCILPARAVLKSIDRIKGPFDPSNIEYLQKGLTWEAFNSNFLDDN